MITYECNLENLKFYEIEIEPPAELTDFFRSSLVINIRYHRYQIKYIRHDYEIVCPEYTFTDGSEVVIIPWFLIPGRPYPIQIYLYACKLYSSNPDIGQRGAAESTRTKFKLKTFSHSTVSRSFRTFEQSQKQSLEQRFGEELKICGAEIKNLVAAATKIEEDNEQRNEAPPDAKHFPSIKDTAVRREKMAVFLQEFDCHSKETNIEIAGRQFVETWHKRTLRLLL